MKTQQAIHSNSPNFNNSWKTDLISGLLVSLIALPLCLGIAMASGFPAFGGVVTAIIGGIIVGPICGSELTIKGPAAGLIAIAIASVETLGQNDNYLGYRYTLAVIVVASIIQMIFATLKLGKFGDFFPASAVHGMLAAIGVIIFSKQIHVVFGVKPTSKEPLPLLGEIPNTLSNFNPEVALVGLAAIFITLFSNKILGKLSKFLPGPLLAVFIGIAFSIYFDFPHPHDYHWHHKDYKLSENFLVNLPNNFLEGVTFPDFAKVATKDSLIFVLMFALIGSLESLLTVKAVDALDPYKRKANLNKDLLTVGFGNLLCSLFGGLPMISEVVRSYSNIGYGARTRYSNFFHGAFLLLYVLVLANYIHLIPVAALAGILCVTGYRLASPHHFVERKHIGTEQLIVFSVTIVATLLTDLLVGVSIGIACELALNLFFSKSPKKVIVSKIKIEETDKDIRIKLPETCTFLNVISFKKIISSNKNKALTVDITKTKYIDHTFMREIIDFKKQALDQNIIYNIEGLENLSTRGRSESSMKRM